MGFLTGDSPPPSASAPIDLSGLGFTPIPDIQGRLVLVAGETGVGKTFLANGFFDQEWTFFLNTEPVNTTTETLKRVGNSKVWTVTSWQEVLDKTELLIRTMKPHGKRITLVLDSASPIRQWIKEHFEKTRQKDLKPYDWKDVNQEFRQFLTKVTVEGNHDLIMTHYLKPNYTKNVEDETGRIKRYGVKDGTYGIDEWDELPYYAYIAIQLERGVVDNGGTRHFQHLVFARTRKTRIISERFKPLLMRPWTCENILKQLSDPYDGTLLTCLAEFYKTTNDAKFKADANKAFGSNPEWVELVGGTLPTTVNGFRL